MAARVRYFIAFALAVAALFVTLAGFSTLQANAATLTLGQRVYAEAQTRAGDWYVFGADGPSTFDCSGLVMWAAHAAGLSAMPRDTFEMLAAGVADGILIPTSHPVAGDLAFFGTGHVEFVARGHDVTFGAQQTGTQVGYHPWSGWWHPTMYFRIA